MVVQNILTNALGASDATNLIDAVVPGANATLVQVSYTTKTVGTTTGTFGVQIMSGAADAGTTALSDATATTFIDVDAAAGTVHGQHVGNSTRGVEGEHLAIKTVKTGTVTLGVVMLVELIWQL